MRFSVFKSLFILVVIVAFPASGFCEGSVGVELDLSLFQFIGEGSADFKGDNVDQKGDLEFDSDISPGIGIYVNYEGARYFVGGKLFITDVNGDGEIKSDKFEEDGSVDISMTQVGPWFGYYFSDKKVRPMILGGLTYNMCKLDPIGAKEGDIDLMGVHLGGGVKYFINDNFALGGGGRLDYFLTIAKYEEDMEIEGFEGKLKGEMNWLPLYGFFFLEYHWGKTTSATP